MIGEIYKITNLLNNKCYIGKTYNSIEDRFKQHIADSSKSRNINRPLYKAIKKYGSNNFTVESLGMFEEGILEDKEVYYINLYDTYKNGYNATLGGDGKRYFSYSDEEVIEKYEKDGQVKSTAIFFKCDEGTVRNILRRNNIKIEYNHIVNIKNIENDKMFDSVQEVVDWLKEKEIVTLSDDYNTQRSIRRVLDGTRKSYKKLTFEYV